MNKLIKPKIGVIPGDPAGIGPELIAKLLAQRGIAGKADILLIGDPVVFELGQRQAGCSMMFDQCADREKICWNNNQGPVMLPMQTISSADISIGEVSRACGSSVLKTLDMALYLVQGNKIDGIIFGPFNKASMHLAGLGFDDELHYMANYLKHTESISELNTLDGIWTSRVTSHIALSQVSSAITKNKVCEAISLIDTTLKRAGLIKPRIAVAALNPHAGDGGNFGREEIDVIAPGVKEMQQKNIIVSGPWPSDTVFLQAKNQLIDAVVTMYHDQGQIALKLLGFDRGVTVQGGLPYPVTTPAHGTAFDIAGQGKAEVGATLTAFNIACDMVSNWS